MHGHTKHLLCGCIEVPEPRRAGAKAQFWTYQVLHSTCLAPILNRKCGWSDKAPPCPLLTSGERHGWKRYENTQSGANKGAGEPFCRSEFVLHIGTTTEFLAGFTGQCKVLLPHFHRDHAIKNNKHIFNDEVQRTELGGAVALQSGSDYAAQRSPPREFTQR